MIDQDHWFTPERLQNQEIEEESQFLNNGECPLSSDFRSYLDLNKRGSSDDIHLHNLKHSDALSVSHVLQMNFIKMKIPHCTILELGCGAGFSTRGLKDQFKASQITAIDVSRNAIEYAIGNISGVNFLVQGIDKKSVIKGAPFDVIIAYEFYPFSRTKDWDYQVAIILQLLSQGKYLYIANLDNDCSVFNNLDKIATDPRLQLIDNSTFPKLKIFQLIKNVKISALITKFLCLILKKRYASSMVLTKTPGDDEYQATIKDHGSAAGLV